MGREIVKALAIASLTVAGIVGTFPGTGPHDGVATALEFTSEFRATACTFRSEGRNPFFILEPGHRWVLEGEEDGKTERLVMTVLDRTKDIHVPGLGTITTRIVRERHTVNGELVEVSSNYFAICRQTSDVYYFGEDVKIFHPDGSVTHDGAWRAGRNGARPGIIMPGTFLLGARYFQELAPGVALDRAEHVRMGLTVRTPAGTFDGCVRVRETTPLEPGAVSLKTYCPGIGLVGDDFLRLVEFSFVASDD